MIAAHGALRVIRCTGGACWMRFGMQSGHDADMLGEMFRRVMDARGLTGRAPAWKAVFRADVDGTG